MQQIVDWLNQLGMSEYAQCFAENKIDFSVLPYLTDQDLKDIGIPLGLGGKCSQLSASWPALPRQHLSLSLL